MRNLKPLKLNVRSLIFRVLLIKKNSIEKGLKHALNLHIYPLEKVILWNIDLFKVINITSQQQVSHDCVIVQVRKAVFSNIFLAMTQFW